MSRPWISIGRIIASRTRVVAIVLVPVTAVLGLGLTRLEFETSQASLIDPASAVYRTSTAYQARFGGEPMIVLYTGAVDEMLTGENAAALTAVEDELRATGDFAGVLGPITALRFAEAQLEVAPGLLAGAAARAEAEAAGPAAKEEVAATYAGILAEEATRLGAAGARDLANPAFVEFLLTDAKGQVRPALGDNFPDLEHAVLIVRLPGNASIAEQGVLSDTVREIVARHPLPGVDVVATGPPVLLKEINDYLRGGMATLGALAAVVMLVLLWVIFRARWRLLSLGIVAVGLIWAFGALGFLGIPLSMVTISGLPILLGLGVDFSVQTHNRFEEQRHAGDGPDRAVEVVMTHMAPPLTIAMVAAVFGFLALQLSTVPMIKDFGILLALGMVVLVVETTVTMTAVLAWRERRHPVDRGRPTDGAVDRLTRSATKLAPGWALLLAAAGLVVGAAGLAAEGSTPIQTDPEAWVGPDSPSVAELVELREGTGFSTELGFSIKADDVTSTAVVAWIDTYARRQLERHGDALVRATSLPTIVSSVVGTTPIGGDVETLLEVAPTDIVNAFVSPDRTETNLIFPIANLSLQDRERLLDEMVADLDPPAGVSATPSGLVVVGIELVNALEANRQVLTLAALGLVALWLLLVYRRPLLVVLPLVPVVAAVGASSLAIDLLGLELTPLTTVSGPLAIAITTEFSVLLLARFLEERQQGAGAEEAVERAATRIGRAFLASGLTLLGGFVVLAISPMPLLVDFGVVVAIDVALALTSVLVVLPPLLRRTAGWLPAMPPPAVIDLPRLESTTAPTEVPAP